MKKFPTPEELRLVYKTQEIDIPEELKVEGYDGKMHIEVTKEQDGFKIRPIIGHKEGLTAQQSLELEPTPEILDTEEQAKERADYLLNNPIEAAHL